MDFYHSGNIPVDLAERSFAAGLALRMPGGGAPLFALSGLAKKKTAKTIEHGYWSKQYDYPTLVLQPVILPSSSVLPLVGKLRTCQSTLVMIAVVVLCQLVVR